jgi:hypothetical protein
MAGWIGMRPGRTLKWDPVKEKFEGDDTANGMLSSVGLPPFVTRQMG